MDDVLQAAPERVHAYAQLVVQVGLNLQPGQCVMISAELAHAPFVRQVADVAYQQGARYVHVAWFDAPLARSRMKYSRPEFLEDLPEFEIVRHRQMVDERWARLSLTGDEFPDLFDDVDPNVMQRVQMARAQKLRFYTEAMLANAMQWCVAAVPTRAWARKVFPQLDAEAALDALWKAVLRLARADVPDPVAAWRQHEQRLRNIATFLTRHHVRRLRFVDRQHVDGKPASNLSVTLTERPAWVTGAAVSARGVPFIANIPTEEVFTAPHAAHVEGWVRTSRPFFPLMREVRDAFFRFERGEVVEFHAAKGQEVLEQFFKIPGANRLGEVALVDVRSPVHQSGLLFYETLLDENAACHIAFGSAYPECMEGGTQLDEDARLAAGLNKSDTHVDVMIGTPTMDVIAECADGREVVIMQQGQFTAAVMGEAA
ncbi:MAG: aminopeptidase [Thermoflexales bacterium]|nr:aminopeptidase [Thermoflexales bacterium]MDW8293484.1 aminopeptidase [Anaerolineae bacterium]